MKCDKCEDEATVYTFDRGKVRISAYSIRPGQIIPCDDPQTFEAYCDYCWALKTEIPGIVIIR